MILSLKSNRKPNYRKCEFLATRLLQQQSLSSLNISVTELKYDKKIIFDTIQNYCRTVGEDIQNFHLNGFLKDGCTIVYKGFYLVLYNYFASTNPGRLNWTLAHEIGHIYLEHKADEELEEREAHWFAAQLLMPEYIIRSIEQYVGRLCSSDLTKLFNVSEAAAYSRLNNLSKMYKRPPSKEEYEVLRMCKPCIDSFCMSKDVLINPKTSDQYYKKMLLVKGYSK
ncbi:MAG: ImmA/IrrE family metallo-endopeptidase [Clostridia bacterium]|nr:ImmA/IrrE family metallo-endopeptidase [Clostridia bacterium]